MNASFTRVFKQMPVLSGKLFVVFGELQRGPFIRGVRKGPQTVAKEKNQ